MSSETPKVSAKDKAAQKLVAEVQSAEIAPYWLAAIIESAEDAIVSKTLDGIIASWNKGAERLFGYTADEVIGQPVTILIPPDHLDEEPSILARIRAGDRVEHYETVRVRKDGQRIHVSLTVSPIRGAGGQVIGASKIARDITALKLAEARLRESEARFAKAFNSSPFALTISSLKTGRLLEVNETFVQITGFAREEAVGRTTLELGLWANPEEREEEMDAVRQLGQIRNAEYRFQLRNGKEIVGLLSAEYIEIGGEPFALTVIQDITERKLAEQEREQLLRREQAARQQAEEASRLKDEFLATVSHELRTPLTSMMGWLRMLRDGVLSEADGLKALETIERNTRSQAQLVEDLLDISRIVSGKLHLEARPLSPASVVNAAVDAIRPAAEAKNIRLQMVINPSAGPVVGDYERLQQVVWNLLSNAVKFTPMGGSVQIQLERAGPNVEVTVSDNGQGIKPEFLPRAFERFSQADGSITRAFGGLGVGLSIVKSIVELHGGTVRAFSEGEGKGATFTVSLPLADKERGGQPAAPAEAVRRSDRTLDCPPELAGLRILVVDDELDTCEMVSAAFRQCGATVKAATSAAEALGQLEDWVPDVLVADISMPEMDGYELVRQIRRREPKAGGKIPAVALTALTRIEDRVKVLASGYQMHVAKPVELGELRTVVASLASMMVEGR